MSVINIDNRTPPELTQREVALRKVLFATDFSTVSENAWPYALAISRRYQSKLFLVHVIAPSQFASVPAQLLAEAKRQARTNAEDQMQHIRQLHGGTAGLDCQSSILEGDVSEVLLGFTKDHRVDLLVAGTHGHRQLNRLLLGSVAEKLFRQSPCPVLVISRRAHSMDSQPVHRILYATDFSPESADARAYAMSLASRLQAQLILLHVVEDEGFRSTEDRSRDRIAVLDRLHDMVPVDFDLPLGVRFEVAFGDVARNISRISSEYYVDLVVIGVHSAAATAAHEEERTAYRIILSSDCPVLTVPRSRPGSE